MTDPAAPAAVVTCEHASNRVPARFAPLFIDAFTELESHRGFDQGALPVARRLARALEVPLLAGRWTRLLVDLNRSEGHPRLFSEWTKPLPPAVKEEILARFHRPHREAVRAAVAARLAEGRPVVHLAIHSFTPILDGEVRDMDVGLLYDPRRPTEAALADRLARALADRLPELRLARNRPYRGTSDGLPTTLRGHFQDPAYAGLEIEINQALAEDPPAAWRRTQAALVAALAGSLAG